MLFIGLAVLAVFFMVLQSWKKKVKKNIGDPVLVNHLIRNFSPARFNLKFLCVAFAFSAGILTVMNPRKAAPGENISRKGIDVMILMDVSKSMLARDLPPDRLERAKQLVLNLMNEMPNDRIGLVLFAGKAYLQMPLTNDHPAARLFISSAGPGSVPRQGTVISDALQMGELAFNKKEKRFKTMVLISDGEDHDPDAVQTAREMAAQGVMINTVGIGSPDGIILTDPVSGETIKDETGNPVVSKLNEGILRQIAASTNGVYHQLQSSKETVDMLLRQFSQIEKKSFEDSSMLDYKNFFRLFAAMMMLLLLAEFFILETKPAI